MRTVEAEGSTVDDAIASAIASLGVAPDEAEIEILEEASRGLLGMGSHPARVRATARGDQVTQGAGTAAGLVVGSGVSRETAEPAWSDRVEQARELLSRVLHELTDGFSVRVASSEDPATISLVVDGGDAGIVIGHHGQTLDAIEHVLNRIVFRDEGPARGRVAIDMEAYRTRRQEQLEQQALRLAQKVRETGRSVPMNPMSARDRRTVHLVLRNWPGVTTESEGEGYDRHVVIAPDTTRARNPSPGCS